MPSKTITTTKFDDESNFLLWKMRVTSLAVKEGTHKALLGIKKKPSKMEDAQLNDTNFHSKATIILCLSDEHFYNIMKEETIAGLWYSLKRAFKWWEFVKQALHEEAVIQSSDEGKYAYFTTS